MVLNGCAVDNGTAQYPLLLYSNITYFPMTYHLCRFLGLETNWDNDTRTLSITQTGERGPYVPDTGYPRKSGKAAVTRADYPVEINGVYIDNSEAAYPLFNYGGVTYFPPSGPSAGPISGTWKTACGSTAAPPRPCRIPL